MIEGMEVASLLGKSDHSVLEFKYNACIENKATLRKIFFYHKGRYDSMRGEITDAWRA